MQIHDEGKCKNAEACVQITDDHRSNTKLAMKYTSKNNQDACREKRQKPSALRTVLFLGMIYLDKRLLESHVS